MRKLTVPILLLTVFAVAATWAARKPPSDSAADPRFQLVGFTAATLTGNSGVLGFTLACQDEFPNSRLCQLEDLWNTTQVPDLTIGTSQAWIDPGFNGISGDNSNCKGWTSGTGNTGLTINKNGGYSALGAGCPDPRSVACCALVE